MTFVTKRPQGVYARGMKGNASSSVARGFKVMVSPLAERGCSFIK